MTKEEAKKLEGLFDAGYLILICAGVFQDGPVEGICEEEEGEHKGKVCYTSDTFTDRPLDEVNLYEVEVYAPALDKWEAMAEDMDQDRKDAWEGTLWEIQKSNRAAQIRAAMAAKGFDEETSKAVLAVINEHPEWCDDEWLPVKGFPLELNLHKDPEYDECASLWEKDVEDNYTAEHFIFAGKSI